MSHLHGIALGFALALVLVPQLLCAADDSKQADADAVKKVHQQWVDALTKKDAKAAEALLVADYQMVNPGNQISDREELMGLLRDGGLVLDSIDIRDLNVRVIGSAAIATGRQSIQGKVNDDSISGQYRFTDVFVKQEGKWKLAGSHVTRIQD